MLFAEKKASRVNMERERKGKQCHRAVSLRKGETVQKELASKRCRVVTPIYVFKRKIEKTFQWLHLWCLRTEFPVIIDTEQRSPFSKHSPQMNSFN